MTGADKHRRRKMNVSRRLAEPLYTMIARVNDRRELQGWKLDELAGQTRPDETRPVCWPALIAGQGFTVARCREYKYSRGIVAARNSCQARRERRLASHSPPF